MAKECVCTFKDMMWGCMESFVRIGDNLGELWVLEDHAAKTRCRKLTRAVVSDERSIIKR